MSICFSSIALYGEIPQKGNNSIKTFSVEHKEKTIEVKSGELFLLILPNPGSGGYIVQDPEFDSQIVTLQKMEKKPPSEPGGEGDFGSLKLTFQAKQEGVSTLVIRASRPWEKDQALIIFKTTIKVSK